MTRDEGLEALEIESWNSGVGILRVSKSVVGGGGSRGVGGRGGGGGGGGAGVTTSSRHWGVREADDGCEMTMGPVGVGMVGGCSFGDGATDWKA